MPNSRLAWQHLGEEYSALGRTADAQRALTRAQQLAPAKKKS
jgi:cytochrome c-type biogenesis protein CcmH/NrfG